MSEVKNNQQPANNDNEVLASVLSYIIKEGNALYKIRNKREINYDFVMNKVIAFDTVEKHIRSQLQNCS